MKVGILGAGNLGSGLAYRLVTTPFVSELYWANRTYEDIERKIIDIQHGLAFAPTCHTVRGFALAGAARMLSNVDVLVVTLGKLVPKGGTREAMYRDNAAIYRESVVPALRANFKGSVVVITNPVDLMTRLLFREARLDWRRVMGLGTVVETARLRASLGAYLSPSRPARDVWAHAIGTHDANFVAVAQPGLAVGDTTEAEELKTLVNLARGEVVKAAERVKHNSGSSLHPIVEGTVKVIEAMAYDQKTILTVSVLDPETPDQLFYSMPCCLGTNGVEVRYADPSPEVLQAVHACRENLRKTLCAGEG